MNIIDHTSDDIRQIVPADFSFLSDADQQVTAAPHAALAALLGLDPDATIAVSGCQYSDDRSTMPSELNCQLTAGTLLHGGRLYTLAAYSWQQQNPESRIGTMPHACISFEEQLAAPSPVYGADLTLSQQPHRHLVARLCMGVLDNTYQPNRFTPPNGVTDYILPTQIHHISQ